MLSCSRSTYPYVNAAGFGENWYFTRLIKGNFWQKCETRCQSTRINFASSRKKSWNRKEIFIPLDGERASWELRLSGSWMECDERAFQSVTVNKIYRPNIKVAAAVKNNVNFSHTDHVPWHFQFLPIILTFQPRFGTEKDFFPLQRRPLSWMKFMIVLGFSG